MAKGSQLYQLKSALSQAGLTEKPNKGKKRKRAGAVEKDKEAKAAKLNEIDKRLNPFDVKVARLKHDVGGRKIKGVSGKPAQSRQAGIEQVSQIPPRFGASLCSTCAAEENTPQGVSRTRPCWRNCRPEVW